MGRPRKHRRDLPERVYYSKGAYYYVHITTKWERLDSDYSKAMARWAELLQTPTQCLTVSDLLDRYLLEVVPGKAERTQADNRREVRYLRAYFGSMAIEDVETHHVAQYVDKREAKTRGNREVALLSHAFNKARLWGITRRNNPCSVPGTRNSEKPRDRYVTDEEITEFKALCPDWLKAYIDLKLLTGLRQRDLLDLTWEQNVQQDHLVITTNKTQKKLKVYLSQDLRDVLTSLPTKSANLFQTRSAKPYTSTGFASIWSRIMSKFVSTGKERFTEHDLRGKVATDMEDAALAQKLLGHKSITMTEEYIKQRQTDVVQPAKKGKT